MRGRRPDRPDRPVGTSIAASLRRWGRACDSFEELDHVHDRPRSTGGSLEKLPDGDVILQGSPGVALEDVLDLAENGPDRIRVAESPRQSGDGNQHLGPVAPPDRTAADGVLGPDSTSGITKRVASVDRTPST